VSASPRGICGSSAAAARIRNRSPAARARLNGHMANPARSSLRTHVRRPRAARASAVHGNGRRGRAYYGRVRLPAYRVPTLVNEYERVVDEQLTRLCERHNARLFQKVGLKDVLPIHGSGLDDADYTYALMAHFDFVITDQAGEALLAVEFDGGHHRTDPQQIIRDDRKNRICKKFMLPLVRAGASSLHRADHRTLLEWLIEVFFEQRRLSEQHEVYQESGDAPDYDPEDWNYREVLEAVRAGARNGGLARRLRRGTRHGQQGLLAAPGTASGVQGLVRRGSPWPYRGPPRARGRAGKVAAQHGPVRPS
jgi:hypothetical protein